MLQKRDLKGGGNLMKLLKSLAIGSCYLFVMATVTMAQMGRGPSMPNGLLTPTVGAGAVYETTTADGTKTNAEFAIVGREQVNGKDGFWMEMSMTSPKMGAMVTKTLIVPDGSNTTSTRTIMQMGSGPAMELPAQMMSHMNGGQQQSLGDIRGKADLVGTETVTTPAGTFVCQHYRMKDGSGDTWVSAKAAPLGVVKHQGTDASMVLTKVITDEKDKITGPVQPFNPALMMQQHNPNQ
jgi:hypothetical protein